MTQPKLVTPSMTREEIDAVLAEGGEVTFAPGVYENASYTLSAPARVRGFGATLIGGERLRWEERDGVFAAAVSAEEPIRALVVNGGLRTRCRMPASGYLTHETVFDVRWMSTTGGGWQRKPTLEELTTLRVPAHTLDAVSLDSAEATVVHSWDESLVRVAGRKGDTVTFASPCGHPAGAFGVRDWCLWNVPEAFTEAGTFYHDLPGRTLYYRPLPGETVSDPAYLPTLRSVFRGEGLKGLELEGFTLTVTDTPREAAGFGAYAMTGAIDLRDVDSCELRDLRIRAVGGYGIRILGSCTRVTVRRSEITDCGAGGMRLGSECGVGEKSLVEDCFVSRVGLYYPSAIGIASTDTHVLHCEVCHTSYSALNCAGDDITVAWNLLHDAMEVLNDGAAIYSFGSRRGRMAHNLAYGIHPKNGHHLRIAYYLDETAKDWLVEENAAVECDFPNHNHMCGDHLYRNNVFTNSLGGLLLTMHNAASPNRYVGNRLCARDEIRFSGPEFAFGEFSGNVCFSGDGLLHWEVTERYETVGEKTLEGGLPMRSPVFFTPEDRVFSAEGLTLDLTGVGVRCRPAES